MSDPTKIRSDAISSSTSSIESKLSTESGVAEQKYLRSLLEENKKSTIKLAEDLSIQKEKCPTCDYTYGQPAEGEKERGISSNKFKFSSNDEAFEFARKLQDGIKKLGFDCRIIDGGQGNYTIETKMPSGFEGQDPLKMDPTTLKEAQEVSKKEKSLDVKVFDKSSKDPTIEVPNSKVSPTSYREYVLNKYVNKDSGHSVSLPNH
jgi:hypothetical protein